MSREEIFQRLKGLIAAQLNVSSEEITESSDFIVDLHADSLAVVDLVMSIEDEFNLKIDDEDAEQLQTVFRVLNYLEVALQIRGR